MRDEVQPLAMSKDVVRKALHALRPADRFNIICFAGSSEQLSQDFLSNTENNIARGLAFLESRQGSGGERSAGPLARGERGHQGKRSSSGPRTISVAAPSVTSNG